MNPVQTFDTTTPKSGPKNSNFATIFTLFLILLLLSSATFASGYLWGKSASMPKKIKNSENKGAVKVSGQNFYEDKNLGFSLSYPKDWTLTKKQTAVSGLTLTKGKNSIDLWLAVEQPVVFSPEQKAALVTTNNLNLKIGKQTAKMIEHIYTAGNYFSIVSLSASQNQPLVTFWLRAENQEEYQTTKQIIQSFRFI